MSQTTTIPESPASQEQTLTELMPLLLRTAFALTRSRDRAEDLAQETLLRVWARLRQGEQIADLRPYLLATLRNLSRRPPRLTPVEAAPPSDCPCRGPDLVAFREVIAAIRTLPREQSRLIVCNALEADGMADIVSQTGLPSGTVASRLSRARARLRRRFDLPRESAVSALLGR